MKSKRLERTEIEILRLLPGEDLKQQLAAHSQAAGVRAGCVVSGMGSLSEARLRLAGQADGTQFEGPLEIQGITGTVASGKLHLHLTAADHEGRVFGGHLLDGCLIRTTAEIIVANFPGTVFARKMDQTTGSEELCWE